MSKRNSIDRYAGTWKLTMLCANCGAETVKTGIDSKQREFVGERLLHCPICKCACDTQWEKEPTLQELVERAEANGKL